MKLEVKNGERFGSLIIVKEAEPLKNRRRFLCQCKCGVKKEVYMNHLRSGNTKSCGCLVKEKLLERSTHGMRNSKTYRTWVNMKSRCNNKNSQSYKNYGGRGIKFCKSWNKFENFYKDMGDKPEGRTLDRINNSGDYCKENCRWTDWETQANNRRGNVFIEFKNDKLTISQWERKLGIKRATLNGRLRRGWSVERALTPIS